MIAACGLPGSRDTGWTAGTDWNACGGTSRRTARFNFASWPLYIDTDGGKHPSLDKFTKSKTGNRRHLLSPVIQEQLLLPDQPGPVERPVDRLRPDRDLQLNGWQLTQLMQNKRAGPLDHFADAELQKIRRRSPPDLALRPAPDLLCGLAEPGNGDRLTTSAGRRTDRFPRRPSIRKLKGKIGMLSDPTSLHRRPARLGINPQTSTYADWQSPPTC